MFMSIRKFVWLALGCFVLVILLSIAGGVLQENDIVDIDGVNPTAKAVILGIYILLFCILVAAIIPLFIRAFTNMQTKIGNGEIPIIKFIKSHERVITYTIWIVFLIGLAIGLPLALRDWMNSTP